jgi:hypothetical protein
VHGGWEIGGRESVSRAWVCHELVVNKERRLELMLPAVFIVRCATVSTWHVRTEHEQT